jgi:hypothetical protein
MSMPEGAVPSAYGWRKVFEMKQDGYEVALYERKTTDERLVIVWTEGVWSGTWTLGQTIRWATAEYRVTLLDKIDEHARKVMGKVTV